MPVFMSEVIFKVGKIDSVSQLTLIDTMKTAMITIKECKVRLVDKEFHDAVLSLVQMYTLLIKEETSNKRSDQIENIKKFSIEYQTVEIFCEVCADILKYEERLEYPGIKPENIELLLNMLLHLINISYNNDDLRSVIAQKKGFLITVTKCLQEWKDHHLSADNALQLEGGGPILEMLFVLLHNISMCGIRNVPDVNFIVAMKPYLESTDVKIGLLCFATLAVLAKECEFKILKSNANVGVIEHLKGAISTALKDKTYNGWSLGELARTVWHLARNDNNKRLFVEHNVVPVLMKIIDNGNNADKIDAISAILELSFDNNNRTAMRTEWNVIEILERTSKSSDHLVQTNSKKALWTIQNLECSYGMKKREITRSDRRVILISYNSCNKDVVGLIRDRIRHLENRVIKILEDTSESNTVEGMIESVEKANIVLVCYSFKYKNSLSSRIEAEYALQLGKTIMLLNIEEDYKADGWLDWITTFTTSFDLSTPHLLDKNVNVLIQSIEAHIYGIYKATEVPDQNVLSDQEVFSQKPHWHKCVKFSELPILQIGLGLMSVLLLLYCLLVTTWCCYNSSTSCCYNPSISCCYYNTSIKVCSSEEFIPPSPTPIPGRPDEKEKTKKDPLTSQIFHSAMNWTLSQVEKWLKDKIIQKDMFLSQQKQLQKLRGKDVAFLKLLVHECPTTFYQTIREQLGMKDIQSMSDFRFALEDIETVQDSSSKHNTSTKALETEERSNV